MSTYIRSNLFPLLTVLFLALGCELFTTRTPEPPTGATGVGWEFPYMPYTVLDNLVTAVRGRSSVDYMRSFTSDEAGGGGFSFVADPETASRHPGLFDDWRFERERAHVESLFNSMNLPEDSLAALSYEVERETLVGDSAYLVARYELDLGHLRPTAPRRMRGRLEFRLLRQGDGGWYVQRWVDLHISGYHCWSDLKACF